jgi:hypothetical protein
MKVVPKAERAVWREKALDAAKGADLHSVMELFVEIGKTERLADLVRVTTDAALENISHYATEPAAMKLEKPHPALAARLWRAQAMRIVDAGKSKYYDAAAANLEHARKCYLRAGLAAEWEETVRFVRAGHHRKPAFMAAFEPVAAPEAALVSGARQRPLGRGTRRKTSSFGPSGRPSRTTSPCRAKPLSSASRFRC